MDEVNLYLKSVSKKFAHEPSLEKLDKAFTEIASKISANEEHFKYNMRYITSNLAINLNLKNMKIAQSSMKYLSNQKRTKSKS
jgi:hypothetical protein